MDLDKATAFRPLFDERGRLHEEINDLDKDIADLGVKVNAARKPEAIERDIEEWKKHIEDEKKKKDPEQSQITSWENYLETLKEELQTASSGAPQLKEKREEKAQKKLRFSQVEQKIADAFRR